MWVIALFVGEGMFKGDLKDLQYVCSGVKEEGRAGSFVCAMGWTSAAIVRELLVQTLKEYFDERGNTLFVSCREVD